jgi:hypothetical protein
MRSFQSSGLVHAAGIATSLINSGQQWLAICFYLFLYLELINVKKLLLQSPTPRSLCGIILCLPTSYKYMENRLYANIVRPDRSCKNRDFPNGWAPLQHMIVEGLLRSGLKEARSLAEDIAVRWIKTNYVGYKKTGAIHEKYDVQKCGEFGGGGEYIPQVDIKPKSKCGRIHILHTSVLISRFFGDADWFWLVKWSCVDIFGGVWMA